MLKIKLNSLKILSDTPSLPTSQTARILNSTQETILFQISELTKTSLIPPHQSKTPSKNQVSNSLLISDLEKMLIRSFQEITLFHTLELIKILRTFKTQSLLPKRPFLTHGHQLKTKMVIGVLHLLPTTHHMATTKMYSLIIAVSDYNEWKNKILFKEN